MNTPDATPQMLAAPWMAPFAQFTDPSAWQSWMKLPDGADGAAAFAPVAKMLGDIGAGLSQGKLEALRNDYLQKAMKLWQDLVTGKLPSFSDRRFSAPEWTANAMSAYSVASYLLNSEFLMALAEAVEAPPRDKQKIRFAVQQIVDAMSPANFLATNPEAQQKMIETKGESLTKGLQNMLADLQKGRISQSDESAFEVGRNVGVTPGTVVFENHLFQLIQYTPTTPTVHEVPLLMVPPCINKYYILDLQPENSFVAHAVGRGHTVFMVSWRNVRAEQGHLGWDDYLERGVFTALRVAKAISGADRVNALGFCVGGTLLGAALAVLAAKGEDLVASATFLATMLDFSDTGQIGLFVDEASVAAREAIIGRAGILPGSELAFVFSSLRANDLVWPYVVNNYLLGTPPDAFDLLYWNADSTNLPGPMYCYYLRNTYLENRLRQPGALTNCGVAVDLGAIRLPVFVLATREDHIVPWRSAYRTIGLLGGDDKTFVLGASGHIAGVVNPAKKNRRSYWTSPAYPSEPEAWFSGAAEHKGSWWPLWSDWLARHAGGSREAPSTPGNVQHRPLEAAPGRYVKQRIH